MMGRELLHEQQNLLSLSRERRVLATHCQLQPCYFDRYPLLRLQHPSPPLSLSFPPPSHFFAHNQVIRIIPYSAVQLFAYEFYKVSC